MVIMTGRDLVELVMLISHTVGNLNTLLVALGGM